VRHPLVWFEIVGQHSDSLREFYAEVLDWRLDAPLDAPLPAAPRERVAGRRALARRSARERSRPPWWMTFYTCVPDLESTIRRARSLGGRVLVPPTQHGDTTFAVVSDPEGHPVGLCS